MNVPRVRLSTARSVLLLTILPLYFAVSSLGAQTALAAGLPYQAFGAGLKAGQSVEAFDNGVSVGKVSVDASGNWVLQIPADRATNGDVITFRVDGALAKETVTFQSGGFPPPPGLTFTLAPAVIPPATSAPGTFVAPPVFGANGQAAVVFLGGTVDQLSMAAGAAKASGAWMQDSAGTFQLLIVGGPSFLADTFKAKFPAGFGGAVAVTLTR